VAANLAAYWSGKSWKALLVDADPFGSASTSKCVRINETRMAVAKSWGLVLVDTAGGRRDEQ